MKKEWGALLMVGLCLIPMTVTATTLPDPVQELEKLLADAVPSLSLDEAFARLGPAERGRLRAQLQDMIRVLVPGSDPRSLLDHAIQAVDEPDSKQALQDLRGLLDSGDDATFFATLIELEKRRGITVPLELFRTYQEELLARPGHRERLETDRRDAAAWRLAWEATRGHRGEAPGDPSHVIDLEAGSADEGGDAIGAPASGPGVQVLFDRPRTVDLPGRVVENSKVLANLFNQLAGGARVTLDLRGPAGARPVHTLSRLEDLVTVLTMGGGCTISLHEARAYADFLDASVAEGGRQSPIRIPTWIRLAPEKGARVGADRLPAIHSEILIAVRKEGRLQALTSWFMSLPTGGAVQGVSFHPAIRRRASWSGYRIVRSFEGMAAASLFPRIAPTMKSLNMLEERHQLPRDGYGCLAICNDTTAMVVAYLASRYRDPSSDPGARWLRTTAVWPLVRDPRFDFYLAQTAGDQAVTASLDLGGVLPILPTDTHVPANVEPLTPEEIGLRIGVNLPCRRLEDSQLPELTPRLPEDPRVRAGIEKGLAFFEAHGRDG